MELGNQVSIEGYAARGSNNRYIEVGAKDGLKSGTVRMKPSLNLRSAPNDDGDNILAELNYGAQVNWNPRSPEGENNYVPVSLEGWIVADNLTSLGTNQFKVSSTDVGVYESTDGKNRIAQIVDQNVSVKSTGSQTAPTGLKWKKVTLSGYAAMGKRKNLMR